jgi:hypothetical protein
MLEYLAILVAASVCRGFQAKVFALTGNKIAIKMRYDLYECII